MVIRTKNENLNVLGSISIQSEEKRRTKSRDTYIMIVFQRNMYAESLIQHKKSHEIQYSNPSYVDICIRK